MGETIVGEFVALTTSFLLGDNEATAAQARQMVRHVPLGQFEMVGEVGRIVRPVEEAQQDPTAGRIGKGTPHPVKCVNIGDRHGTIVKAWLYYSQY